jgi:peptidyl-prolyl cis-trans isomerase-like protein 2
MGKSKGNNQMHMTSTEWKRDFGGFKKKQESDADFKRLPFSCCALSFLPFEHPVCNAENGVIYDLMNIIPWIKKHKFVLFLIFRTDPASGNPLAVSDLIRLKFTKDDKGVEFVCPITLKTLNDYSHIIAIKTSGNVYSFDAVDRLKYLNALLNFYSIKIKNWKDLIDETPFKRSDIITLQDPKNITNKSINTFHYIKNKVPNSTL